MATLQDGGYCHFAFKKIGVDSKPVDQFSPKSMRMCSSKRRVQIQFYLIIFYIKYVFKCKKTANITVKKKTHPSLKTRVYKSLQKPQKLYIFHVQIILTQEFFYKREFQKPIYQRLQRRLAHVRVRTQNVRKLAILYLSCFMGFRNSCSLKKDHPNLKDI